MTKDVVKKIAISNGMGEIAAKKEVNSLIRRLQTCLSPLKFVYVQVVKMIAIIETKSFWVMA